MQRGWFMKTDYRQTLGSFQKGGNFVGDQILHRTPTSENIGTLSCNPLQDGGTEWFIVLGMLRQTGAPGQHLHPISRESEIPLSEKQLSSIIRKDGLLCLIEE
jgi:hypothetical protein